MKKTILFILCLPLLAGCGVKKEYVRMRDQLDYLETSQKKMESQMTLMDSLLRAQTDITYQLNAEMRTRWGSLNERMMSMDQQYEDQQSRPMVQTLPLGSSKPDNSQQIKPPTPPEKPKETSSQPDPKQLYDTAYLDITRGNYDLAIAGFREFLKLYPTSSLADNSQYWIGEGYYAQKKYQEALAEFEKVIALYPNQDKAAAAYYKSGLCYKELGNKAAARENWEILIKKFPRSPEAGLAQDRIKELP
ncbi:MAG: tol-pal system protein YbgF [Candidatus Edwardsbacteria bacterium]|nr:tol-pal system protein YbgF [Candidatus Edwardsbacteria bacterium]MBU1575801.1 tol-pal system protein YbgF [Candidatus Edwardsbacteria bacterium]MBU2463982.1 tol-pal system protein YbgF [Candidatus Edwardsbacteria bacterium]MBU2593262.1 tol-pal system protein YbgF [Candidatus Edwardsbacteria bacterium]